MYYSFNKIHKRSDVSCLGCNPKNGWASPFYSKFYLQMARQEDTVYMYVSVIIVLKVFEY